VKKIKGGFVLEARQTFTSEIWKRPAWWYKVWRYIIMKVNWFDNERTGLKRGSGWFTYKTIYSDCHLGLDNLRVNSITRTMQWLKASKQISTTKSTRGFIINVINYNLFQDFNNYEVQAEIHTPIHIPSTGSPQPVHTISEGSYKEVKKKETTLPNPAVRLLIAYFIERFTAIVGTPPMMTFPACGALAKSFLAAGHTLEDGKKVIDFFFTTDKAKEHPTFEVAFSSHSINLWKTRGAKNERKSGIHAIRTV